VINSAEVLLQRRFRMLINSHDRSANVAIDVTGTPTYGSR
jgi:hypothetical protein